MRNTNASTLANFAGKLLQIEEFDEELLVSCNYLRFRAKIQVNHPLVVGCLITRKCVDRSSALTNKISIDFKFERLPSFCTF